MSSPNFNLNMLYTYKKKNVQNVKKGNWLLQKIIFETFLWNLFLNMPPIRKNNFRKAFLQSAKKIPENYLKPKLFNINADRMDTLKWHLKPQSKNGYFECKITLKLHQKQLNILTSNYSKFLIYNNPSFTTTISTELCLGIAFAKINSAIFLF